MRHTVKIGPDLIVSTLTGPPYPYTVSPGQVISLPEATKNQGTTPAGASVTKFYWSTNTTYDASDQLLGQRSVSALPAGEISGPVSTSVTIPSTAVSGTHYIIAKADADNSVAETSETNNTKYVTVEIP